MISSLLVWNLAQGAMADQDAVDQTDTVAAQGLVDQTGGDGRDPEATSGETSTHNEGPTDCPVKTTIEPEHTEKTEPATTMEDPQVSTSIKKSSVYEALVRQQMAHSGVLVLNTDGTAVKNLPAEPHETGRHKSVPDLHTDAQPIGGINVVDQEWANRGRYGGSSSGGSQQSLSSEQELSKYFGDQNLGTHGGTEYVVSSTQVKTDKNTTGPDVITTDRTIDLGRQSDDKLTHTSEQSRAIANGEEALCKINGRNKAEYQNGHHANDSMSSTSDNSVIELPQGTTTQPTVNTQSQNINPYVEVPNRQSSYTSIGDVRISPVPGSEAASSRIHDDVKSSSPCPRSTSNRISPPIKHESPQSVTAAAETGKHPAHRNRTGSLPSTVAMDRTHSSPVEIQTRVPGSDIRVAKPVAQPGVQPQVRTPLVTSRTTPLSMSRGSSRMFPSVAAGVGSKEQQKTQELQAQVESLQKQLKDKDQCIGQLRADTQALQFELGKGKGDPQAMDHNRYSLRVSELILEKENLITEVGKLKRQVDQQRASGVPTHGGGDPSAASGNGLDNYNPNNPYAQQRKLEELAAQVQDLQEANEAAMASLTAAEQQISGLLEQNDATLARLATAEQRVADLQEENDGMKLDHPVKMHDLEQRNKVLNTEVDQLKERLAQYVGGSGVEAQDGTSSFRQDIVKLRADLRALREQNHQLNEDNIHLKEQLQDVKAQEDLNRSLQADGTMELIEQAERYRKDRAVALEEVAYLKDQLQKSQGTYKSPLPSLKDDGKPPLPTRALVSQTPGRLHPDKVLATSMSPNTSLSGIDTITDELSPDVSQNGYPYGVDDLQVLNENGYHVSEYDAYETDFQDLPPLRSLSQPQPTSLQPPHDSSEALYSPALEVYGSPSRESHHSPGVEFNSSLSRESRVNPAIDAYSSLGRVAHASPAMDTYSGVATESYHNAALQSYSSPGWQSHQSHVLESYGSPLRETPCSPAMESLSSPLREFQQSSSTFIESSSSAAKESHGAPGHRESYRSPVKHQLTNISDSTSHQPSASASHQHYILLNPLTIDTDLADLHLRDLPGQEPQSSSPKSNSTDEILGEADMELLHHNPQPGSPLMTGRLSPSPSAYPRGSSSDLYHSSPNLRTLTAKPIPTQHNRHLFTAAMASANKPFNTSGKRPFAPRYSSDIHVGDVVKFSRQGGKICQGLVHYVGHLPGKNDMYLGLELDKEDGRHDGLYEGKRYFRCKASKGVFVAFRQVVLAWGQ